MGNLNDETTTADPAEQLNKSDEPTEESISKLARSDEMRNFYVALAGVQTNAIFRVMSGKDEEDVKKRAITETTRLHKIYSGKCPPGTSRNPITGNCDPI